MKKIIFLISIFLLQVTSVFAESFLHNYPMQTFACICLDSVLCQRFLGNTGKDNQGGKAFKEVVACLKEKFSVDLEKDLEQCGVFVVPGQGGVGFLGMVSGNFKNDSLISLAKGLIPRDKKEEIKFETVSINGKEIQSILADKDKRVIFLKDGLLLITNDSTFSMIKNNGITFAEAPKDVAQLMKKNKNFLYVSKIAMMFLSMAKLPPELISGIDSIAAFMNDDAINIDISLNSPSTAEKMKEALENKRNEYNQNYLKDIEKNKKILADGNVNDLAKTIGMMYSNSKSKEFIDSINLSVNENSLLISTKPEFSKIVFGIIGSAAAFTFNNPNFENASKEARKRACFSNQRVLQGAVEMYNMDSPTMMSTLDMEELVKTHYIKHIPDKPEEECEYENIGDLAGDGYVNCKFHGSPWAK